MDWGESFDEPPAVAAAERLTLDLDGWEGPLDLLLTLARTQKVDLAKISILALTDQYLAFIADAKKLKLEIAADYLVMAAWLAYLKSCLLLPKDPGQDPSPEELAMRLQLRLQRLSAMREAGARLIGRDRIGRDVFLRGAPEGLGVVRRSAWQAELYDLISAYGSVRARTEPAVHVVARRPVMTLEEAPQVREADRLTLDLDGWEGPLDLLLTLARGQKVDLAKISILALVEQYLAFIADAKKLKLEIGADYLVMAAWLAYLKSCLLLPKDPEADPSPEELAMRLQLRLQRLSAMREAGARLMARDRLGRDVFLRGAPEGLKVVKKAAWQADLYDLIAAYGVVRARSEPAFHVVARRPVMTLDEALHRVEKMIETTLDWTRIEAFLPATQDPEYRRSALASSFVAALELARLGRVEIDQQEPFAPLYVRAA